MPICIKLESNIGKYGRSVRPMLDEQVAAC